MSNFEQISRRAIVKSSVFGLLAASIPNIVFSKEGPGEMSISALKEELFTRYPSIDDSAVVDVVGLSHFDLNKVKKLVNIRPELSRATWDWGFGDWETAIGAASHVGRRDIVEYLISKGARPDIFTFAMLGAHLAVKSMIESNPGVQAIAGPHGISLLQHAKAGLRMEDTLSKEQRRNSEALVSYLEGLGNADTRENYLEMDASDKEKYLGDYMYGDGPQDGFGVKLNMRKLLSIAHLGQYGGGGTLYEVAENQFSCNGTTTAEVSFSIKNESVVSLTIREPNLTLTATKA